MKFINKFNIINQSELVEQQLLCGNCDDLLSSPIFQQGNGQNYCKTCNEDELDQDSSRNESLESMLAQSQSIYPCNYAKCEYTNHLKAVKLHMEHCCRYKPLKCAFCNDDYLHLNEDNIINHLIEAHSKFVTELTIDQPIAIVNLKMPRTTDKVFILKLTDHRFILIVRFDNEALSFKVGKIVFDTVLNINNACMIQYKIDKTTISVENKICNIAQLFNSVESKEFTSKLCLVNVLDIELKLYLCNFESVLQMDDCPICLEPLTTELYQCPNGHSVCSQCINNINNTCAICRSSMDKLDKRKVCFRHIWSNVKFPCPNAKAGCLQLFQGNDIDSHLVECFYRKVTCVECKEPHRKNNIVTHMQDKHKVFKNYNKFHCPLRHQTDIIYNTTFCIRFKHCLFRFVRTIESHDIIGYNVQLLYCDNDKDAQKFRYEVHIVDKNRSCIPLYKMGGVCQSSHDVSVGLRVNWKFCKKFVQRDGDTLLFKYRICVFEINE